MGIMLIVKRRERKGGKEREGVREMGERGREGERGEEGEGVREMGEREERRERGLR